MKSLAHLMMLVWLSELAVLPAQAAFSSLYAFGDGACSTTDGPGDANYYQHTYSNGRVWIEVLAKRQGLTYDASKNVSYFGNSSSNLLTEISAFSATDANSSLFVVWVCDADFANYMTDIFPTYGLDPTKWNNMISGSLTNHQRAITNLYAKGARTLIIPNAVDLGKVAYCANFDQKPTIRQGVINFNGTLSSIVNQARASLPGLKIYMPDMFTLLDNMVAHPGDYGLVNTTGGTYAIYDGYNTLNGTRNNWLFWDAWNPTAKALEVLADTVQQVISPVTISTVTALNGSNRLDVANMPVGLSGFVDGRTNLVVGSWTSATNFNSTSVTQTIFVRASGPQRFYRLRFPFAWSWP
jgi:phospholipase/lecithinase/hemolysin